MVLRSPDFLMGDQLKKVATRHRWKTEFGDRGDFEIAVRKTAVPVAAPECRSDYLILQIPVLYPESPQASLEERRVVFDALGKIKQSGKGALKVRFDAMGYSRKGSKGWELTTCNIYWSLPLTKTLR